MANYIKKNLEEGEKIVFNGRLHWSSIFRYTLFATLLCLGGIVAFVAAYRYYPEHKTALNYAGTVLLALAFIVWILGRIVRTRCEFAITDTRFIQKDGIFNIKMTEIPLGRVETVNFYQSLWQRIIGTGCVEMVGSGGTSHQVHCIEHPKQVRKVISSAIKKISENPKVRQNDLGAQNSTNAQSTLNAQDKQKDSLTTLTQNTND